MQQADVVKIVEARIVQAGSLRQLAEDWSVSAAYLSDIRHGKRNPGPKILKRIGLMVERSYQTVYRRAK